MNLNPSVLKKKKNDFGFSASNVRQLMGPPMRPPPKPRPSKNKAASSSSSGTNWGKNCPSVVNSSTLRSGSSTITSDGESRVIVALTEGRGEARCEVGLASIDLSLPTMLLCQISDSQSYINTLTKINIVNPTDIIVPSTILENNRLIKKLRKKFPNVKILGIPRKTFNKSNGMDRILQLCLPSINTICVGLQHKYYALAAASALTTYLQHNLNIYYAKASLNITYEESEGYAIIDVSTADLLELVSSTKPLQASRYATLFGVLNYCVTKVGSRLLRSTILQPPCLPSIIEATSHSVSELIKQPEILLSIQNILQRVANIDQLLTLTSMHLSTNDGCSVRQLNYLLLLNGLIEVMEPLKDVMATLQQPFFKQLKGTLESDNFAIIANKIRTKIRPSASFAKSEAGINERCFAIKSEINGLLDLVRKTYVERLNDLTEYVKHLENKHKLPLTLGNNNAKGYHIILKLNGLQKRTFKKSDLPAEFVQVCRLAGSFTMKTDELINYATRLEDIMLEILKISNSMIYEIIVDLKQYLGFFYKLCEDVARLDLLQSLAEASKRGHYVRPKFGEFTELVNSRHPMLELLISSQSVANPVSICKDFNVQIITGPNGSGKSVYIRQVMLLQIMAQVGCYVPADSAKFRPIQRMFARIYLEDDMEYGASSFILEMKEIKYMMTLPTHNSLFIVDEMCRSTAADEGTSLALAICEQFCKTPVFLYVTTHYKALTNLAKAYFNVRTWQMETAATGDRPQDLTLNFRYQLMPGVTDLKHYGVHIVKNIWPKSMLEDVYSILEEIAVPPEDEHHSEVNELLRVKYKLESDFRKLKSEGKLTRATINRLLNEYQNELHKRGTVSLEREVNDSDTSSELLEQFESSSYRNLSDFLREDSGNVNKLIPDVSIACSERQLVLGDDGGTPTALGADGQDVGANFGTPIVFGTNVQDVSTEEIKSMMEELSRSLIEDDDFDFSQVEETPPVDNQHIFPVVQVKEGPLWSSDHSESSQSESISYSPPCSEGKIPTTIKSSTSETNLDNLSMMRQLDKSSSSEKPPSDERKASTSSSLKESDNSNEGTHPKTLKTRRSKFVPPKKLTREEIEREFNEQDRRLYESDLSESDLSKYLQQKLNRPTVKQVQNSKHLAYVRKTDSGVEVIPVKAAPAKKKFSFKRNLSSSNTMDISIFSDKNAKCLDEFLNSDERDVKRFKFNFEKGAAGFSFAPSFASNAPFFEKTPSSESNVQFCATPDGYYKSNKQDVENIIDKYLGSDEPVEEDYNIFESYLLDDNDLDL